MLFSAVAQIISRKGAEEQSRKEITKFEASSYFENPLKLCVALRLSGKFLAPLHYRAFAGDNNLCKNFLVSASLCRNLVYISYTKLTDA